jgi:hypothetical protein
MTCFWDGILNLLTPCEINSAFGLQLKRKPSVKMFIEYLQEHNVPTLHVKHMGQRLSANQIAENQEHIKSIDSSKAGRGYDCSGADPVLLLIAELFDCNITHIYNRVSIYYRKHRAKKTLYFESNTHHFWSLHRTEY